MENLRELSEALRKGDPSMVGMLTRRATEAGIEPKIILEQGLIAGMTVVGEQFKIHEIFLPDVLLAAKAMAAGMEVLKPLLVREGIPTVGKVVIGTVQGDLHDIGKNLVAILLRGAGFDVIDLGNNVSPRMFVETAERERADIIGMSALLTTTMPVMKTVVELAGGRESRRRLRIIVGGAPLSAEYAAEIGADAYCYDGMSAVDCARKFVRRE